MSNTETIHILHLSDLHFSHNLKPDMDIKAPLPLDAHPNKIDKFKKAIMRLPSKPDYVVVSGDITTRGQGDGFELFDKAVIELIKQGKLPPVNKFIVVPGNHDVKESMSPDEPQRWDNFKKIIGNKYLVPWLVGVDPSLEEIIALVDKELAGDRPRYGGIVRDPNTEEKNSIPFLLDREKKVLFYAFNSSLLSHTKLKDEKAYELIFHAVEYGNEDKTLIGLADKLKEEMAVDPAIIVENEIELFVNCMDKIKDFLGDDYKDFLKIAVLHHHIAPISCCDEVKKFELLINAGSFKKTLVNYGFNVVLHGHKHWNEVYWDTAISGGGALLAVSGGTICGNSSREKEAGFYSLEFSYDEKKVRTRYYELRDPYGSIIGAKEDRVFSYDTIDKNIGMVTDIRHFNLIDLFSRVEDALLCNLNYKEFDEDKQHGWNRIITSKDKVGMVSTAFGLIIATMLGIKKVSYQEVRADIIDTLWKFRAEKGGFSTVSQAGDAAIEATVWALWAFYYVGDMVKFNTTLQDLYGVIKQSPLTKASSITSLTLVMDVLCECDSKSELIDEIHDIILKKAHIDENDGRPLYWSNPAVGNEEGSPVHTMLAVISLLNYAKVHGRLAQERDYLRTCGEWILASKWDNVEESISRMLTARQADRITYQHYTAPWGIIALLRLGYSKKEKRIVDEMRKLLESERGGLWPWNGNYNYPIWAVYNAISAINEFVLCDVEL